jgi:DNA-binding GntR family transcriptional regulator
MGAMITGHATLGDQIVSAIRARIIEGQLAPGERLVDSSLAQQLNTSRPTVREAFRRLEHEGVVVNFPYRGYFVAELRPSHVFELLELRGLLEGRAAEAAVANLTADDIERLRRLADATSRLSFQHDVQRIRDLDIEFHNTIIAASGKQLLGEHWALLNARLAILNSLSRDLLKVDAQDTARRHRAYVDELSSRDPERARAAAEQHYRYYAERFREKVGDREDFVLHTKGENQ